jgi:photosynthetic reaction center cytochrome c subunit
MQRGIKEGLNMKLWSMRLVQAAAGVTMAMIAIATADAQAAPQANKQLADQVFKNVTALKGIPVDEFLGTMGIMSAALGFDCSECHTNAGTDKVDWAFDTPRKVISRKMVKMVQTINHDNFSNRQVVTCWTCHRGRDRPLVTPTMEHVYGTPLLEMDDLLAQAEGQPTADQVLDKYIQALGGQAKLSKVSSYVAKARSVGFGGFGGGGQVQIYAKFPDQRTTVIDFPDAPERGNSIRTYNGKDGWVQTVLAVIKEYPLSGGELDGAKVDAELAFPAQIKKVLTNPRVSLPETIDDRVMNVVQGNGPNGLLVTLYFDQKTGLLARMIRYSRSAIGRVPTQMDFADYRDVDGIKMPFKWTFAWLDGRDTFQLSEVKLNVPIDAAKFANPTSAKGK